MTVYTTFMGRGAVLSVGLCSWQWWQRLTWCLRFIVKLISFRNNKTHKMWNLKIKKEGSVWSFVFTCSHGELCKKAIMFRQIQWSMLYPIVDVFGYGGPIVCRNHRVSGATDSIVLACIGITVTLLQHSFFMCIRLHNQPHVLSVWPGVE